MKHIVSYKKRRVEILELAGIDTSDFPDFSDAYICDAVWVDTGESLTVDELDELTNLHSDVVHDMAHDRFF
jgi:hypothetical protein